MMSVFPNLIKRSIIQPLLIQVGFAAFTSFPLHVRCHEDIAGKLVLSKTIWRPLVDAFLRRGFYLKFCQGLRNFRRMFGDKALDLVKELKRSMDGTLPPYNVR